MHCFPSDCDTGCTYMCLRPKPVIQQLVPETVPKTPTHSTPAAFPVLVCLSSKLQTPIICLFVKLLEVGSMLTRWFRRDPESDHYSRVWYKTNTNGNTNTITISNTNTNICVSVCNVVREETPAVCGENTNTG